MTYPFNGSRLLGHGRSGALQLCSPVLLPSSTRLHLGKPARAQLVSMFCTIGGGRGWGGGEVEDPLASLPTPLGLSSPLTLAGLRCEGGGGGGGVEGKLCA